MPIRPTAHRLERGLLGIVLTAIVGVGSLTTSATAAPRGLGSRPDAQIRVGITGAYQGDDIYSMDDPAQTVNGSARLGHKRSYFVVIQNDGQVPAQFRLRGRESSAAFSVHYRSGGSGITAAVVAGTYTTPELAPGATVTVKVTVGVGRAQFGQTFNATLAARSTLDADLSDRVRFITLRRCGDLGCH